MPLTSLEANVVVQWAQARSNGSFAPTRQGVDSIEYNLSDLSALFDRIYVDDFPVGGTEYAILDLTDVFDLVCTTFRFTKVLFVAILVTGEPIDVITASANGFPLWGAPISGHQRAVTVEPNGVVFWGGDPAGVGLTVDQFHRFLEFHPLATTFGLSQVSVVVAGAGVEISSGDEPEPDITANPV